MITLYKAQDRGHSNLGWLDSWHSFSFGEFYDPKRMGYGTLRVINDDRVAAGMGFGTHPHRDMEIISIVIEGKLQHRDSMGNGAILVEDEIQYMSAGTGIEHSEFNPEKDKPVHFIQIWIHPDKKNYPPAYAQRKFVLGGNPATWQHVLSGKQSAQAIQIRQDAELYVSKAVKGSTLNWSTPINRKGWLHIATGRVLWQGQELLAGDALALDSGDTISLSFTEESKVLLFDLPV